MQYPPCCRGQPGVSTNAGPCTDLSTVLQHIRVGCKSRHSPAQVLWGLAARQLSHVVPALLICSGGVPAPAEVSSLGSGSYQGFHPASHAPIP